MNFEIVPVGLPITQSEWLRALDEVKAEVPELTSGKQAWLERTQRNSEGVARFHEVVRSFAKERERRQAEMFGQVLEEWLSPFDGLYTLRRLDRFGAPDGWRAVIAVRERTNVTFQCLFETVDAVVGKSATHEELANLRQNILDELAEAHSGEKRDGTLD